ncbi:hypothetical protein Tco_0262633 [Tanacetum coccineum]
MAFVLKHNQVGFLKKPEGSAGFEQIVDFLKGTHIRYALEHNPTIYVSVIKQFWQTVTVITLDNGEQELKATIDTHEYTISESSVRNKLKLADENGITELTNAEIFEGMANLGYPIDNTFTFWKKHFTPNWKFMVHHILHCISSKSGGWDQFGSKLATALICLSTGRTYNFSKMIFEAMVANVTSQKKFLMYPRFLSMILEAKPANTNLYLAYQLTKKIFGNMNRGFAGVNRPLLANMIAGHDENQGEPQEEPVESQPPPNASVPSTSQPTTEPHPDQELETETELHGSSSDFVHTPPTQVETSSPELKSISPEPMEHTYDQPQPSPVQQPASPEPQPTSPPKSPPLQGPTSTYAEATRINVADLLHLVPQLVTRIDNLEKELKENKQTTAAVIVKLVKKVKKLFLMKQAVSHMKKERKYCEEQPQTNRSKNQFREEEDQLNARDCQINVAAYLMCCDKIDAANILSDDFQSSRLESETCLSRKSIMLDVQGIIPIDNCLQIPSEAYNEDHSSRNLI